MRHPTDEGFVASTALDSSRRRPGMMRKILFPQITLLAMLVGTFTPLFPDLPAAAATSGSGECVQTYAVGSGSSEVLALQANGSCYVVIKNTGALDTQSSVVWSVPPAVSQADLLVVAGGGGGGTRHAPGGGAGGLIEIRNQTLTPSTTLNITVGSGGSGAANSPWSGSGYPDGNKGQDSSIQELSLTALGGGGGSTDGGSNSLRDGGSGAGSSCCDTNAGSGDSSQGSPGGSGYTNSSTLWAAGGGGGAAQAGGDASSAELRGGHGGNGKPIIWIPSSLASVNSFGQIDVNSDQVYFAGGGGGGTTSTAAGTQSQGGLGGGGIGGNNTLAAMRSNATEYDAVPHTGGGGGGSGLSDGSTSDNGGDGGSGIVVIRYTLGDGGANSEVDNYLDLNGTNQAAYGLDGSSKLNLGSSAWTIEAWIKPGAAEAGVERMIINKERSYELAIYNGTYQYALMPADTGDWGYRDTGIEPRLDAWQHVALTKTGNSIEFYFDGQLAYSITDATFAPSTLRSTNLILTVGGRESTTSGSIPTGAFFDGGIDEVRIWSERRTDTQILQSMHAKLDGTQANLLAYWDFNEPAGELVFNRADGVADLSLYNSPGRTDVKNTSTVGADTVITFPRTYLPGAGGWTVPTGVSSARTLVIGGGGGGADGISFVHGGGGGGAGGFRESELSVSGTLAVEVGAGGLGGRPGVSGGDSTFGSISVPGGGGGGSYYIGPTAGASGGGAGHSNSSTYRAGASSTVSPPTYGASGGSTTTTGYGQLYAGGGGGAGGSGSSGGTISTSGRGGIGKTSDITGTTTAYGGGGGAGGGQNATSRSLVQDGGGGQGGFYNGSTQNIDGLDGAIGSGAGGGGGAGWNDGTNNGNGLGGKGGSGIIIVRFTTPTAPPAVSDFGASQRLIDADSDSDSVSLNWTAVTHSPAVTGYTIEWGTDQNYSNTPISVSGGSTTSKLVSGLNDGADYFFRIKAVNEVGSSATGATTASIPVSNEDYALDFDNSVSNPATSTFASSADGTQVIPADGNFTVEAWIKPDVFAQRTDNFYAIVTQNQDSGGTNDGRFFLSLHERSSNGRFEIHVGSESNSLNDMNYYADVDHIIRAQEWAHIAVTSDSTAQLWKLYLNGVLFYTSPANEYLSGTASNLAGFHIGSAGYRDANNPQWHYFNGQIDQVKVWDAALSGTQLVESMHSWGSADVTSAPPLLAHYDFNDFTDASTLKDQAGSFDLTVNNATVSDLKPLVQVDTSDPAVVVYDFKRSYLTRFGGWTVPSAPARFNALVVGGGGGGAGNNSSDTRSSSGSGGAGGVYNAENLALSGVLPITVGLGGLGGITSATKANNTGYQGQSSSLSTLVAGGGGAGGCSTVTSNNQPCSSSDRIHGLAGTASGSGGSASVYWNAYNYGNPGTATAVTLGGKTLAAISGYAGGTYVQGSSVSFSSGSAGGAGGVGSYNAPGAGVAATIPGISGTFGTGGASWNAAAWTGTAPAANTGAGGSGAYNSTTATPGFSGSSGRIVVSYLVPSENAILTYNSTDSNSYDFAVNGSVTDLSGNGVNGTAANSLGLDATTHAWSFPGGAQTTTAYIDIADITTNLLRDNGFTFDFEADFGSVQDWERIIDFSKTNSDKSEQILIARGNTTQDLALDLRNGDVNNNRQCRAVNALNGLTGLHRYTISVDGSNCTIYRDGTQIHTQSFDQLPSANITYTSNFIGRSNWTETNFEGQIRSLRIYKGAFTPSEIGAVSYKTVTLDASPGTVTDSSLITSGSVRLPNPTNLPAPFDGWALTGTSSAVANPFTPSGDVTLEALYSANPPSVSYGDVTFSPSSTNTPTVVTNGHTGAKTFSSTTSSVCSVDSSTGVATILTAGTCSISTVFAASGSYGEATVLASFEIAKANQPNLTWDQAAISYSYLGSLTLTGLVTGGSGTGALSYAPSGVCVVTGNVLSGGSAASSCSVTVTKGGDVNYNPISLTQSITINKVNQSPLAIANPGTVTFGETIQLSSTGGSGTGAVSFSSNSASICSETSNDGEFEFIGVGDCVVTVTKALDNNYNVQTGTRTITSVKATHSLSFTSTIPANPVVNGTYPVTGVSSTGEASLAPSFSIAAASSSICSIAGDVVTFDLDGVCEIEANKAATANYEAAQTVTQRIVVGQANQSIAFAAPSDKTFGDPAFSISGTSTSGNPVTFTTGSGTTNSSCSVTSSGLVVIAAVGTCEIVANSASGNGYAAASPVARTFEVTPDTAGAPFITAVSFGDQSLTATYFAPSYVGGGTISGYQLQAFDGNTLVATQSSCAITGTLSCTVTGLTNGTSYTLKIAAITEAGLGALSPASAAMIPASNPEAVSNLTAVQGDSKLTITWRAPSNLGGGTLDSFRIYHREAGGSYPGSPLTLFAADVAAATTNGVTTFEITSLTNGQAYDVKVITVTDVNLSNLTSATTEVTQTPYTVPDAPLTVEVLEIGDDIVITWSQPVFDGGSAISGYSVLLDSVAATCTATSSTSCTIPKSTLTPGTTVTIDVKAENDAGLSTPASTTFEVASIVVITPDSPAPTQEGPAAEIEAVSGQSWAWTKRISKNEVKVYIKFPEMGANYQISLQKNDGDFRRVMSKTINTTADTDLRVVGEWYYLVRTITLPGEGRYRIEVTQDGQRMTLNGEDRPAVYNYR